MASGDEARGAAIERAAPARVARLATAGLGGIPHLVPICFAIAGGRLFSVVDDKPKPTRTGLRRLRNLAENPVASVLIDHYEEDWGRLWFVTLAGTAGLVHSAEDYALGLAALRAKYPQYEKMPLSQDTHPMIAMRIERVHAWSAAGSVLRTS